MRLQAPQFWESTHLLAWLWLPVALLYGLVMWFRKGFYRLGIFDSSSVPVPIIIVGNIRIGGTGKTPLVIALAKALSLCGFHPGVISRAYLGQADGVSSANPADHARQSQPVSVSSSPLEVGDEPCLIAKQLAAFEIPVWVGRKRAQTALQLLANHPLCNVIICDDGLQHYALKRNPARNGGHDIEIILQDQRGIGNGFLLPAGPLREYPNRPRDLTLQLQVSDQITPVDSSSVNQTPQIIPCQMGQAYPLVNDPTRMSPSLIIQSLPELAHTFERVGRPAKVAAMAGIAYPEKFFGPLRQYFPDLKEIALPDHHDFKINPFLELNPISYPIILITEKDAVKCQQWQDTRVWVVPLEASIPEGILKWIVSILHRHQPITSNHPS